MSTSGAPSAVVKGPAVIRVSIVDHTRLYREGLAQILRQEPGVEVIGLAADADEAAPHLRDLRPDVVLFHMLLPDNLEALRAVARLAPEVRTVALGISETEEEVLSCVEAGALGYLPHEGSCEDLMSTIRGVVRGETHCSPRITATLLRRVGTLTAERPLHKVALRLTVREWQIMTLVDQGLGNKEIARQLSIEIRTVKNHVHNILEKLQVHRRGEAAAIVREARQTIPKAAWSLL